MRFMKKGFYPEVGEKRGSRPQPVAVSGTGQHSQAARGRGSPADRKPKSALFLVDSEIQNDVLAAVKAGDGTSWGFGTLFFRMQFVIGIGIQAAETVVAGVIGIAAADGIGAHVFQKNYAAGKRVIGLVSHHAAHRAELSFALLVLSHANGCKERENHHQTANAPPHVHPLPPAVGCIRNTKLSSFPPVFVSMVRVCSAKPFRRTTIS